MGIQGCELFLHKLCLDPLTRQLSTLVGGGVDYENIEVQGRIDEGAHIAAAAAEMSSPLTYVFGPCTNFYLYYNRHHQTLIKHYEAKVLYFSSLRWRLIKYLILSYLEEELASYICS